MRIDVVELKKAIQWLEANSRDLKVNVFTYEGNKITFTCMDKLENEVEITLYSDGQMMPKIKRTDILR